MIVVYFILLLVLYCLLRKNTHQASLLLGLYLISAFFSLIKYFFSISIEEPINEFATFYYIVCIFIGLAPFLIFGRFNSNHYHLPSNLILYLSILVILGGLINLCYTIPRLFTLSTIVNNLRDIRAMYYQGDNPFAEDRMPLLELISNLIQYISFLAPLFCLYYYTNKKYILSTLLFIASLSSPFAGLLIGEREATLVWISNYLFSFVFFKSALDATKLRKIYRISFLLSFPLLLFLVIMTISRFSDEEGGVFNGIITYAGEQPFNFSYFFNHLSDQSLDGKLNFGYFFPTAQRINGQLNEYLSSPKYLNVFASFPGSFFLDFGYAAIFYIILISSIVVFFLYKKRSQLKYSFFQLYILYLLFQILFMGIFYYDFTSSYAIIMNGLVVLIIIAYNYLCYLKKLTKTEHT